MGKVLPCRLCWAAFSCEEVGKLPSAPLDHNQPWWFFSEVTRVTPGLRYAPLNLRDI